MSQGKEQDKGDMTQSSKKAPKPGIYDQSSKSSDEFRPSRDKIWDDVIRHERILEKIWNETWANTIVPKELRPANYPLQKVKQKKIGEDAKSFYRPHPCDPVPVKSSGKNRKCEAVVGWRSSNPQNSMEYFNVRFVSNKIRFMPEQYGYYRHMKYVQEEKDGVRHEEQVTLPSKNIKHKVKVLLC